MIGIVLAFIWETLDTRVRKAEEIAEQSGLPLLAACRSPARGLRNKNRLATIDDPNGAAARSVPHAADEPRLHEHRPGGQDDHGHERGRVGGEVDDDREPRGHARAGRPPGCPRRPGPAAALSRSVLRLRGAHRVSPQVALGHVELDQALARIPIAVDASRGKSRAQRTPERKRERSGSPLEAILEVLPAGPIPPDPGEFSGSHAVEAILEGAQRTRRLRARRRPAAPPCRRRHGSERARRRDHRGRRAARSFAGRCSRSSVVCSPWPRPRKLGFVVTGAQGEEGYGYGSYYYARTTKRSKVTGRRKKEASVIRRRILVADGAPIFRSASVICSPAKATSRSPKPLNFDELMQAMEHEAPEIALIDLELPPSGGVAAVAHLAAKKTARLVVWGFEAETRASPRGADGRRGRLPGQGHLASRAGARSPRDVSGRGAASRELVTVVVDAVHGFEARDRARERARGPVCARAGGPRARRAAARATGRSRTSSRSPSSPSSATCRTSSRSWTSVLEPPPGPSTERRWMARSLRGGGVTEGPTTGATRPSSRSSAAFRLWPRRYRGARRHRRGAEPSGPAATPPACCAGFGRTRSSSTTSVRRKRRAVRGDRGRAAGARLASRTARAPVPATGDGRARTSTARPGRIRNLASAALLRRVGA